MKKFVASCFALIVIAFACDAVSAQRKEMLVRLSEVEIFPEFIAEYNAVLIEEAAASIKLEPGVVSIFPMYKKDNPTEVRILEIYADRQAYEFHLKTPHFQKYKKTTLKMVKSLRLIDMTALDAESMAQIFKKQIGGM